ncbi:MAG: hypothetical protein IKV81_04120 [Clostridia bacterium]|nr:hypothetical protein [Clostridia bacterium]
MKKTINLIIVVVLIFSLLTACSTKSNPSSNKEGINLGASKVDTSNIYFATEFSNGLAFIQYEEDKKTVYCIDKTGKELFELEDCNLLDFAKFNGKIAMIETSTSDGYGYIICDKKGKVYNAADFGASQIVLNTDNHKKAFLDGYIILERREESYTGTKIEMSIIDSDFTTLVPFSAELAEIINNDSFNINGTDYYDGYMYCREYKGTGATVLNLRTGTLLSDTKQMEVSKPLISYYSDDIVSSGLEDFLEGGDIYNELTCEVIAKVKDHEAISQISFIGDIGLATYWSDNGIWFNVIEQNGTAKFEPLKADSENISFDGETILVSSDAVLVKKEDGAVYSSSLKTYDVNGNLLGELVVEGTDFYGPIAKLNDGVIWVNNHVTHIPYNSTLDKLF